MRKNSYFYLQQLRDIEFYSKTRNNDSIVKIKHEVLGNVAERKMTESEGEYISLYCEKSILILQNESYKNDLDVFKNLSKSLELREGYWKDKYFELKGRNYFDKKDSFRPLVEVSEIDVFNFDDDVYKPISKNNKK